MPENACWEEEEVEGRFEREDVSEVRGCPIWESVVFR